MEPLPAHCPRCLAVVSPSDRYCAGCGDLVLPTAPPEPPPMAEPAFVPLKVSQPVRPQPAARRRKPRLLAWLLAPTG